MSAEFFRKYSNLFKSKAITIEAMVPKVKGSLPLQVKSIANKLLGKTPYSTKRIAGGTVYRMSYPVLGGYRASDLGSGWPDKIKPNDKDKLNKIKNGLMNGFKKAGLDMTKIEVKFHLGSYVYANVRVKLDTKDYFNPTKDHFNPDSKDSFNPDE